MTIPNSDAKYVSYSDYDSVIREYNKYDKLYDEKEEIDRIIKDIDTKRKNLQLPDHIFNKLHKLLRNSYVSFINLENSYCIYVNYWLNQEVRNSYPLVDSSNFYIFHTFAKNFNDNRYGSRNDNACLKYIKYLNDDIYRRMTNLYDFYTFYDKLSSHDHSVSNEACNNLSYNAYKYNDVINDFYNHDHDLYNKISYVKDLVEAFLKKPGSKCTQSVYFRIPQKKILDDEEKRKQEAEAEAERQRKLAEAEAETQGKLAEKGAERGRQEQVQQELVSQNGMRQMHTNPDEEGERILQGEPKLFLELGNLRETVNVGAQERSKVLPDRLGLGNIGRFEDLQEPISGQQYENQLDKGSFKPGNEDTNTHTDGSFLGSLRLPGVITEVLGSVDPVPVVGVSGGMGALFLLFRYTPFGSFFRGGRGRARRIPSGFSGQYFGAFPGYEDFYDGGFGNGPINISYRPELE